ncbi:hypothetical protein GGR58DRAFT_520508 [Xylaria digitata]|nr:hypothetical protein GGR58DRAFT_520508 [Xylaria digitata]
MSLMEKAIVWACEECKADIISIASGFEHDDEDIRRKIKLATANDTLVFAAASNYGNMKTIFFPARLRNDVFGIFSTDARAKVAGVSLSINPPRRRKGYNFAILGEDVVVSPYEKPVTGTSYATSIAAGLAAKLIDFSRQSTPASSIRLVNHLHSFEGMAAVFMKMVGEETSYHCLRPWKLLEHALPDETRQCKRERVCDIISGALERRHDD